MFLVLDIKSLFELTWEDIPYIESPVFAIEHVKDAIGGAQDYWSARVTNIHEFAHTHSLQRYSYTLYNAEIESSLGFLFSTGSYFSVARNKIPFAASFGWRELESHPDGGEWYISHYNYADGVKQKLEAHAKYLGAKRRRMLAEQAEEDASPAALISAAKRVVEKRVAEKNVAQKSAAQLAQSSTAAQSLAECEKRLSDARERLITNGYQSKFSDAQIQALAQTGELDDRFVVRLIETKYAGDNGYLGQMKNGEVKYWSTTFNQMENADTDPQTLCALIGVDYKPGNAYSLVIVDAQAKGAGQSVTIVPTHKNLGDFAKREIKGINADAVDGVMTPEYSQEYAEHMLAFKAAGASIDKEKDISDYADANFSNETDKEHFESRIRIHERLGANEHYTGDGTTKNLIADCPNECGVMETFTYDKNPHTLAQLESNGSAKRIAMTTL